MGKKGLCIKCVCAPCRVLLNTLWCLCIMVIMTILIIVGIYLVIDYKIEDMGRETLEETGKLVVQHLWTDD